jgi:hypothetical protein
MSVSAVSLGSRTWSPHHCDDPTADRRSLGPQPPFRRCATGARSATLPARSPLGWTHRGMQLMMRRRRPRSVTNKNASVRSARISPNRYGRVSLSEHTLHLEAPVRAGTDAGCRPDMMRLSVPTWLPMSRKCWPHRSALSFLLPQRRSHAPATGWPPRAWASIAAPHRPQPVQPVAAARGSCSQGCGVGDSSQKVA